MLTPEDAKRLVKNRNARWDRMRDAQDAEEQEQLDFLEEQLAIYLEESDFVEYVTDMIDAQLEEAINQGVDFHTGFYFESRFDIEEDLYGYAVVQEPFSKTAKGNAQVMLFNPESSGIECDANELAELFCQTVRALYEDAEWDVSNTWICDYALNIHRVKAWVFKIRY